MERKTIDEHGGVLLGYKIKLGSKATKILDRFKLDSCHEDEYKTLVQYFNSHNTRYQKIYRQADNFKNILVMLQDWIISIEDSKQRESAQMKTGLIVIDKEHFCIWVEMFKTFIGSHSTINNLLNTLGCTQVSNELATELKHKTILGENLQINRNWSARTCNGIFDEFFDIDGTICKKRQNSEIKMEITEEEVGDKEKTNTLLLDTNFGFEEPAEIMEYGENDDDSRVINFCVPY